MNFLSRMLYQAANWLSPPIPNRPPPKRKRKRIVVTSDEDPSEPSEESSDDERRRKRAHTSSRTSCRHRNSPHRSKNRTDHQSGSSTRHKSSYKRRSRDTDSVEEDHSDDDERRPSQQKRRRTHSQSKPISDSKESLEDLVARVVVALEAGKPNGSVQNAVLPSHHHLSSSEKLEAEDKKHNFSQLPEFDLSDPAPPTKFVPLNVQPAPEARRGLDNYIQFTSLELLEGRWNGWPSGPFGLDLTAKEFRATNDLQVHWVTKNNGGDSRGSINSSSITGGRISNKRCVGVIRCTNSDCSVIIRPKAKPVPRQAQLQELCRCGSLLVLHDCASTSFLITWGRIGTDDTTTRFRYINGAPHNHPRIPQVKHFTAAEQTEFNDLVKTHPTLGPVGLMVGPPVVGGYGRGAVDIGQAGRNKDYVAYKARQVKSRALAQNGHWFIDQWAHWQQKHPGIVRTNIFSGELIIISIQTGWMCRMLLPEVTSPHPVNGLVSDAAHGYWSEGRHLLITTSVFCAELGVWVPGIFTFTNGATLEHYKYHFIGVFESIIDVAQQRRIEVTDRMFVMVVDYSDAQSGAVKNAFIDVLSRADFDHRTLEELDEDADKLLRGCTFHFHETVIDLMKVLDIVPREEQGSFRFKVLSLCDLESPSKFDERVEEILQQWPHVESWLNWWLRPEHARMIFPSQRLMSTEDVARIPSTTNAQESMHHTIYRVTGKSDKGWDLIQGLDGLLLVERYFHSRYDHKLSGGKDSYGKISPLESRQKQFEKHGRTKPSRNPGRKKRDLREGKPPKPSRRLHHRKSKATEAGKKRTKAKKQITQDDEEDEAQFTSHDEADHQSVNKLGAGNEPEDFRDESDTKKQRAAKPNVTRLGRSTRIYKDKDIFPSKDYIFSEEFTIISPKKYPELPGIPWYLNSCWLDVLAELLWALFGYSKLHWLELLQSGEATNPSSRAQPLYDFLRARHGWALSSYSRSSGEAENLKQQRDDLRSALLKLEKDPLPPAAFRSSMAWLNDLIPRTDPYFCASYICADLCGAQNSPMPSHILLSSPRGSAVYDDLDPATHKYYHGKIADWFRSITDIQKAIEDARSNPLQRCWRRIDHDDSSQTIYQCTGSCLRFKFLISFPSVLILESDTARTSRPWDFPRTLKTDSNSKHSYELVGRIFHGHQHFIGRFSVPTSATGHRAVYEYDGMENDGYSRYVKGSVDDLLAGTEPLHLPSGYKTAAAIYRLKGGVAAQKALHEKQVKQAKKLLHIDFTDPAVLKSTAYRKLQVTDQMWADPHSTKWFGSSEFELNDTADNNGPSQKENPAHHSNTLPEEDYNHASSAPSSSPGPSEPLPIICRCGVDDDGHRVTVPEGVVECSKCHQNSHLACQTSWRLKDVDCDPSRLTDRITGRFICDRCISHQECKERQERVRPPTRPKRKVQAFESLESLHERLHVGIMVLVKYGPTFYYPARLLVKSPDGSWIIKWWRRCQHPKAGHYDFGINVDRMVDGLYGNVEARRGIQLGEWTRAHLTYEKEDDEEALIDPESRPYTTEIRKALKPHREILTRLLHNPTSVSADSVPAIHWQKTQKEIYGNAVPFTGSLNLNDQLAINNWFFTKIDGAKACKHEWIGTLPIAHARTLVVASRFRAEFEEEWDIEHPFAPPGSMPDQYVIENAWQKLQVFSDRTQDGQEKFPGVDVDLEALKILEFRIFDNSKSAGKAGDGVWGLDVGPHENRHNFYDEFAPENEVGYPRRDVSNGPEPGPNYDDRMLNSESDQE